MSWACAAAGRSGLLCLPGHTNMDHFFSREKRTLATEKKTQGSPTSNLYLKAVKEKHEPKLAS